MKQTCFHSTYQSNYFQCFHAEHPLKKISPKLNDSSFLHIGEKGKLRYITPQPLCTTVTLKDLDHSYTYYNMRKLNELPYHLLKSQQSTVLKKECLCNFEFLLCKISATSLRSLFEDFQMALEAEPGDQDLR